MPLDNFFSIILSTADLRNSLSNKIRSSVTKRAGLNVVERHGDVIPSGFSQRHFDGRVLASEVSHRPVTDRHSGTLEHYVRGLGVDPGRVPAPGVP